MTIHTYASEWPVVNSASGLICWPNPSSEMNAGKSPLHLRHRASDDECVRDVLIRAAAAGDEDAKALIVCSLLEQQAY